MKMHPTNLLTPKDFMFVFGEIPMAMNHHAAIMTTALKG